MNFLIFIFILLVGARTVAALPSYLVIPADEVELIEARPEFSSEPSMVRVARRIEVCVPTAHATVQTEDVESIPRIERAATPILDYVDFGGHTGENGAFGWYADFPAHQ